MRALLAYLALAPLAVSRSQLCELLWDVPNDPSGELGFTARTVESGTPAVGSYTYAAHVDGNSDYTFADSLPEPLAVVAEPHAFCSPGFWRPPTTTCRGSSTPTGWRSTATRPARN